MNHRIESLGDERAQIKNKLRDLLGDERSAKRVLSRVEERDYESLTGQLRNINREVAHEAYRSAPSFLSERQGGGYSRPSFLSGAGVSRGDALTEEVRDWVSFGREVSLPVTRYLAAKRTDSEGRLEHRDVFTTSTGAPVSETMATSIYEYLVEGSGMLRSNVSIFRTPGGETFKLPRFTAYSAGSATPEGTAINESDPTFAHVEFGSYKFAAITSASSELWQDAVLDLGPYLARNLATAMGESYHPHFITGNGTAEPQGILTAGSATVVGGTGVDGVWTADQLVDLYFDIGSGYRTNASWLMNDAGLNLTAKLKDSDQRYLLSPSFSSDIPSRILGRPVYTDPTMPAPAVDGTAVAFGDWSRAYGVRFAGDLRIELSRDYAFASDELVWRSVVRVDGRVIDPNAYRCFVGGTA